MKSRSLAALLLAGCFVTETGNPPAGPVIDPGGVDYGLDPAANPELRIIEGAPGTITPAGGTVLLWNLDRPAVFANVPVDADGGFVTARLPGSEGDEWRLVAIDESGRRSRPWDFRDVPGAFALMPVDRALADCLVLTPPLERVLEDERATIRIANGCAEPVALSTRWRETDVDAQITPAGEFTIASGDDVELAIRRRLPAEERILLIELRAPVRDRRPISIR